MRDGGSRRVAAGARDPSDRRARTLQVLLGGGSAAVQGKANAPVRPLARRLSSDGSLSSVFSLSLSLLCVCVSSLHAPLRRTESSARQPLLTDALAWQVRLVLMAAQLFFRPL